MNFNLNQTRRWLGDLFTTISEHNRWAICGCALIFFGAIALYELRKRRIELPNHKETEQNESSKEEKLSQSVVPENTSQKDPIDVFLSSFDEPSGEFIDALATILTVDEEDEIALTKRGEDVESLLASEVPSVGLQEVLFTSPPRGSTNSVIATSPAGQRLRVRDLVQEVQTKTQELNEMDAEFEQKVQEIEQMRSEIEETERRLEKVDELRRTAESERDLMQSQLQKLHLADVQHHNEREEFQQQLRQTRLELQLLKSSSSSDPAAAQKVQAVIEEMRQEQEKAKSEARRLRDTNKSLLQKTVNEQKYRERLLRQISELKDQLKQQGGSLTGVDGTDDLSEPLEEENKQSIWGFNPPSPAALRSRRATDYDNESDSGSGYYTTTTTTTTTSTPPQ